MAYFIFIFFNKKIVCYLIKCFFTILSKIADLPKLKKDVREINTKSIINE